MTRKLGRICFQFELQECFEFHIIVVESWFSVSVEQAAVSLFIFSTIVMLLELPDVMRLELDPRVTVRGRDTSFCPGAIFLNSCLFRFLIQQKKLILYEIMCNLHKLFNIFLKISEMKNRYDFPQ